MKKKSFIKTLNRIVMLVLIIRVITDLQIENYELKDRNAALENNCSNYRKTIGTHDINIYRLREIVKDYKIQEALINNGARAEDITEFKNILGIN